MTLFLHRMPVGLSHFGMDTGVTAIAMETEKSLVWLPFQWRSCSVDYLFISLGGPVTCQFGQHPIIQKCFRKILYLLGKKKMFSHPAPNHRTTEWLHRDLGGNSRQSTGINVSRIHTINLHIHKNMLWWSHVNVTNTVVTVENSIL